MATLNRFISRLGEKGLPFFKLLKKLGKFEWTNEADEAFQKLKEYLSNSPILTPLEKYEPLLLYIAATTMVVSTAMVVERAKARHVYKV
jgi:dsDNA-binding SOS-regulon protein